jgi:hypothetical protein
MVVVCSAKWILNAENDVPLNIVYFVNKRSEPTEWHVLKYVDLKGLALLLNCATVRPNSERTDVPLHVVKI